MRNLFVLIVALTAMTLTACQSVKQAVGPKEVDYRATRRVPTLEVPPDLTAGSPDDALSVPDVRSPTGAATYSAYASERQGSSATPAAVLPQPGTVRMERAGTQRWLVMSGTPEAIWPRIRDFWLDSGLILEREDRIAGVMETGWAENRADVQSDFVQRYLSKWLGSLYSTGTRDRFRVRLEPGQQPGTTEIYLSHRGMVEKVSEIAGSDPVQTMWEPRPSDPEIEAEMLRRLMVHLGVEEKKAATVVASAAPVERARMITAGTGQPTLNLDDEFERAWRRVGLSLDRVGFTVEDRNRSDGVYFVRYADPDAGAKKPGFFKRMFTRKKRTTSTDQYQVKVSAADQGTNVTVLDKGGKPDTSEIGGRILALLYEQLK